MGVDVALSPPAAPAERSLRHGVRFAQDLARHGHRLAMVGHDGARLTYAQLAERVSVLARRLGTARKLVLIAAANEVDPLVSYLAALAAGHPVLLAAADDPAQLESLLANYDPDVVLRKEADGWRLVERRAESVHRLHPELALLLSTSGSTGSPKLVRLSAENLQANAAAIATYLDIRDTDRAVTSLPMQYCYGLSVINSNLLRGAALLLTDDSVIDERFWSTVREYGGTSVHGVPYTFELLDRAGFDRMELPSIRYLTQAGGRLEPDRAKRFAELADERGWRFFVMYGQTEATARMAYLPPDLVLTRPNAVGIPIPGGRFELASTSNPDEGELIYHGPNVMLGYAESPADLAAGRTVDSLATGDLARRAPDGLYEIIGRTGRFVKPCGLRVDLDQVERALADAGYAAACAGTDEAIAVAVTGHGDLDAVTGLVSGRIGLPTDAVRVCAVDEFPRLSSGKLDYPAIQRLAKPRKRRSRRASSVREVFARVLHGYDIADIADDATFATLGGDSLSFVRASIELEKLLGFVPDDWQTMAVADLERIESRRGVLASVETNIVLRALAIVLIVGTHVGFWHILGGAHLLLVLAGWAFARFCLGTPAEAGTSSRILRSGLRVAIPSMVWLGWRAAVDWDIGLANLLLVNNYVRETPSVGYWFVEVLVQTLLALSLAFAIPAVRRFDRGHPFVLPLIVLVVSLIGAMLTYALRGGSESWSMTHVVLPFFALGWLAFRANSTGKRLAAALVAVVMIPGFFDDLARGIFVAAGVLLVLIVPRVRLPRPLVAPIGLLASASLYIYLTHYALWLDVLRDWPPLPLMLACIGVGVATWLVVEHGSRLVRRMIKRGSPRTSERRRGTSPVPSRSTA